ncbi:MAG TPA: hypothetical protein VF800_15770 [Telluria sp.]|jgi:hypothetical protein
MVVLAPFSGNMGTVAESATQMNQIPAIARFLMGQGLALLHRTNGFSDQENDGRYAMRYDFIARLPY